jgi:hypothetical protein
LFADRLDALSALPKHGAVAEVGVAFGDFSMELLRHLTPRRFVGIDQFGLEALPELWGRPMNEYIGEQTHEAFYRARLEEAGNEMTCEIEIKSGQSWDQLEKTAGPLDVIYIDAGHEEAEVRRDCEAALPKLSPRGIVVFNDYIWRDTFTADLFGVVAVVNDLLEAGGWDVVYLALHPQMFCDIALTRSVGA